MVELCAMASSSTYVPGVFQQEQPLYRSAKEFLSVVPCSGRKQEIVRSGLLHCTSPLVGDPLKPMGWLFSDQGARLDSNTRKPVLIDVQDARPNSILFSFGISENYTKHQKIMQYLMSGSSETEKDRLDLLSSLTGMQTSALEMRLRSLLPRDDGVCLYEDIDDESRSSILYPSNFYAQKQLLDPVADLAPLSKMTVHPDGRVLFTGPEVDMKDLLSIFSEFHLSKNSMKGRKQPMLVPHFSRLDINEPQMNIHGSSLKTETMSFTPLKSRETIKLRPSPKKRSSRKAGREKDLCRRSHFHACESLLSVVLDKNRGKAAISSLKKSGPELPQLLTQFSAGIAGTGLAVLFSVVCNVSSGKTPFYAATLLNIGFGSAMVWLSWAVNKLRNTIVHISRSSSKVSFNEKEMMRKVDNNVNEIYFRAAAIIGIVVLKFA
ncbi:Helicase [Thalictrum thalictroides]|uniref:Helicase n=1 Tax=Thalictrum thalictroides TaxID=46969 RepID=A0A7J6UT56_THATH|nr:Helicase [Thalictrum thalictroides]